MHGVLVWLVLARAKGIGNVRLASLMERYPDPSDAWRLSEADLANIDGWGVRAAREAAAVRQNAVVCHQAEEEWERAITSGLRLISLPEPEYPSRLRQTPNPPPLLYQTGPWVPDDRPAIAVIGTRKATSYGLGVAYRLGRELADAGAVVVSGMARGIDCAAHRGALEAGGQTVAVLGGGADVCYPVEAAPIYRKIGQTGGILSERSPGTQPRSEFFPERNRIISGLSHGIVVVEAGERSGTLTTVTAALRQGRDVFAIPGPVTNPMSVGPHRLIREGACIATCAYDILEELGFAPNSGLTLPPQRPVLTPLEERLLRWIDEQPQWAVNLVEATGISAAEIQSLLTMLELKGVLKQLPSGQYVRDG